MTEDFDGWHIGEWKKTGAILFIMTVIKGWNVVVRWVTEEKNGAVFLEGKKVTDAAFELGFDFHFNIDK